MKEEHKNFAEYVLQGMSAVKAYQKAFGCSYETARGSSSKLRRSKAVCNYIQKRREDMEQGDLVMSTDEVLMRLSAIARRQEDEDIVVYDKDLYKFQHGKSKTAVKTQLSALGMLVKALGMEEGEQDERENGVIILPETEDGDGSGI